MPVSTAEYQSLWMARLVKSHDDYPRDAKRVRFRSAVCRRGFGNNYDESLANVKGRFWYVQLRKRF